MLPRPFASRPSEPLGPVIVARAGGCAPAAVEPEEGPVGDMRRLDVPYFGALSEHDRIKVTKVAHGWAPLLAGLGKPLDRMVACEIGCGTGTVAVPMSRLFGEYIGIDIDAERIEVARGHAAAQGRTNIEFLATDVLSYLDEAREALARVDLFILYAVLEHLTIEERKRLLQRVAALVAGRGMVLVAEAPNRLFPFDSHSWKLHFFDLLPEPLALEYAARSPREEYRERLASADDRLETLRRLGRGVSYHEFDLWFPPGWEAAIVADGYSPALLVDNPFDSYEPFLNDYLARNHLPVERAFARYWIEFLCDFSRPAARGVARPRRARFVGPRLAGRGREQAATEWWSFPLVEVGRRGRVLYEMPEPAREARSATLMFFWPTTRGRATVTVRFASGEKCVVPYDFERLRAARPELWHDNGFLTIESPEAGIASVSVQPQGLRATFGGSALVVR